jgi:hypothetical protein
MDMRGFNEHHPDPMHLHFPMPPFLVRQSYGELHENYKGPKAAGINRRGGRGVSFQSGTQFAKSAPLFLTHIILASVARSRHFE